MNWIRTALAALLLASAAHAQDTKAVDKVDKVNKVDKAERKADKAARDHRVDPDDRAPSDDEQLAIAALEGLMAQPSDRALPILRKVLAGSQPTVVKRRALFVLAQINSPEAHELLMQAARDPNTELRKDAIRSIGISGDPKSLDALQEIYNSSDAQAKKEILQAWMIAGRKQAVYNVAVNAKTEDEASEAIHML